MSGSEISGGTGMKTAIMQPYFLPYIGYFQLIQCADKFVIYDNIEYTKKGWINRNRLILNQKEELITLPLKKDSDYLNICKRQISVQFENERVKWLRRVEESYRKAPCFHETIEVFRGIMYFDNFNLFDFIFNSVKQICNYLEIETTIIVSSSLPADPLLKGELKVLNICQLLETSTYINAIGGRELYKKENFANAGIELKFIQTKDFEYNNFSSPFIPRLSILDVMMHLSKDEIKNLLKDGFELK